MAARARVLLQGGSQVLEYRVDKYQTGERGKIEVQGNRIHFVFHDRQGHVKTADETLEGDLVVGLSIRDHILEHWKDLLNGDTVKIRFGVPERQETVGFELFKDHENRDAQGRSSVIFEMKPTSFFVAALVKPIYFSFDKSNGKLLEFKGRTIPYRNVDGKFQDLDALTVYSP